MKWNNESKCVDELCCDIPIGKLCCFKPLNEDGILFAHMAGVVVDDFEDMSFMYVLKSDDKYYFSKKAIVVPKGVCNSQDAKRYFMKSIRTDYGIVLYEYRDDCDYCDVVVIGNIPYLGFWQVTIETEDNMESVVENLINDERYTHMGSSCTVDDNIESLKKELADIGIKLSDEDSKYICQLIDTSSTQ